MWLPECDTLWLNWEHLHTESNNSQCLLSGPLAVISSDYHLLPGLKGPLSSLPQTARTIRLLKDTRGWKKKPTHTHWLQHCIHLMIWGNHCCSCVPYDKHRLISTTKRRHMLLRSMQSTFIKVIFLWRVGWLLSASSSL